MKTRNGIELDQVSWAYGPKQALNDVSLKLRPGKFSVLLGPNGAGKSTLVSLLCGLLITDKGGIQINGHDLSKNSRSALAGMGIVFQQQTLDLDLSVRQNMLYFAAIRGFHGLPAQTGIDESLERMGLAERASDKVRTLNGGHRRRLEIARALLHRPTVLVLDEPTPGLDVPSRNDIVRHIHSICGDESITVLWATHLVDEVWNGDDLIVLDKGELKIHGPVSEVLKATNSATVLEAFSHLTSTPATPTVNKAG